MTPVKSLPPEALYTTCSLENLDFETTNELEDIVEFVGQDRAVKAIDLGISIERHGYNIYALGPSGAGKYTLVDKLVGAQAANEPPPDDWCYVNNFQQPYMPKALRLPQGMGKQLQRDMERLVEELQTALSSAFESEEYQTRRRVLEEEFSERQQESLKEIQEQAKERGLTLLRTPTGLAFAPVREGNVLPPEEFQRLPEEEQQRIQAEVEALQEQLQKVLFQVPQWEREFRRRLREMNVEVSDFVLNDLFGELNNTYKDLPDVMAYLKAVRADVSEHLDSFLGGPGEQAGPGPQPQPGRPPVPDGMPIPDAFKKSPALRRYEVNVLVDSSEATGAPVIYESNPSYLNLVGRVEQMAMLGALITDFTLIKPGVLHRANGGYLILDALRVLTSPYAWEGLKRALQFGQIRIESPTQMLSLTSTISLEPEPIPLDIKVVLMGERMLYYMLAQVDPDFNELFKVAADFDDEFVRNEETTPLYARLVATVVRREDLRPFDKSAVCRVIEQASRLVSDSERVTARMQSIVDLLEESDHWARDVGAEIVTAEHVQMAVDAQIYRMDRVAQRMKEEILRETLMIDTEGEVIGQINALSVIQFGNFAFGRPTRVTATVRMGSGEVVDIEREVEMGGPTHSKGVLILSSFIRSRYAAERPLALSASLVFEQNYGGVDGDSASSTELYALLSAIARVPIKQSYAVTGSVNQHGQVQAIGGVNEKIEGFFDLCKERGLTGEQGVLIPAANVKHLVLREDVVQAVADGKFAIYPISNIDEGIEILTGLRAGERGKSGEYPKGTVNRMVDERLAEMVKLRKEFDEEFDGAGDAKKSSSRKSAGKMQ